ncbi:DUF3370 family protein [Synechococcus sp. MU1642]|uniref:DUF3370 family protein n=1 Tax=Synechococcus sp. MU1642 TaxID=2508348 RepID=UPI001CF8B20B|nr:DUF3370 family protein [Synechococcus sp. MU1642]MCB4406677.1 DUF3370 family protein [Synechococcus sp. MU1642]
MSLRRVPLLVLACVSVVGLEFGLQCRAEAYVALMAGQRARPLNGTFNNVPVLHSNQPEIVTGPGILVNTDVGSAVAAESNQPLRNATYTFNGEFGVHMHHKYYPQDQLKLGGPRSRGLMTLALIATNPGPTSITLDFDRGSVKNSFEAPYHPNRLMGVKPLGKRPWNTGPGDATAVQLLRGELDRKLPERVVIPAGGRRVVLRTVLPARGIANGLLKGRSNGPFTMAVVAAEQSAQDSDLFAVLQSGRLAPGRIYLNRIREIQLGQVFSRVAGVALGDAYKAEISHDLNQGPLHVPLTSTKRHHFGTSDVQVNPLTARMIDSALNNVGTYGVRYDVTLNVSGTGPHQLVLSHPVLSGKKTFTAFRGSLQIVQNRTLQEVHVGMRSGESLALADLNLAPGTRKVVKVSLVYPADATPGHLLSVVPIQQLAMLHRHQQQQRNAQLKIAETKSRKVGPKTAPPPPETKPIVVNPSPGKPAPVIPAVLPVTTPRYGDVIRSQQQWLLQLQGR